MVDKHPVDRRKANRLITRLLITGIIIQFMVLGYMYWQRDATANEIQDQRYNTLLMNCKQQNKRHDDAVKQAHDSLRPESVPVVILLVSALQPYESDCETYVEQRVKEL